ncbi:hypothetical protein [Patulibacter sp.]|uniref:hypothetical protein n=1 Tax=Patulibacter sp. TaxID=1912859 RepID=UPI00271FE97D|nr:hypothetical protein [Patulibacter sp.]MDO9410645.1 hypothetical protein [Patulibacter sp.]
MGTLATFARVYVSDLEPALGLFTDAGAPEPRLRFSHASGLELALVGDVLVLAGPEEVLAGFRETQVTSVVDDLDVALDRARGLGAEVLRGPAAQETGRNATVRMPFGAVVEYVEWSAEVRARLGV